MHVNGGTYRQDVQKPVLVQFYIKTHLLPDSERSAFQLEGPTGSRYINKGCLLWHPKLHGTHCVGGMQSFSVLKPDGTVRILSTWL